MAREHNVIQQQDRRRNLQPAQQQTSDQPSRNLQPAQQKPATCPTINLQPAKQKPATCQIPALQIHTACLQPANRTINLNHNL